MSRSIGSENEAALEAPLVRYVVFAELSFSTETVRLWSGLGDITALGEVWTGAGELFGAGPVNESDDLKATSLELELDGVKPEHLALAYATQYQGRPATVYVGFLDDAGALEADPIPLFAGLMNTMADQDDGQSARIGVEIVTHFVDHKRRPELRYTDQGQRALYPTDTGLRFVASLADRNVTWGRG